MRQTTALVALAAIVVSTLYSEPCRACSCIFVSEQHHVDGADMIFFGKAGKEVTKGGVTQQPFEVLYVLVGDPGAVYTYVHPSDMSFCDGYYQEGDISLLFVAKGRLGTCQGNYASSVQLPHLLKYLTITKKDLGLVTSKTDVVSSPLPTDQAFEVFLATVPKDALGSATEASLVFPSKKDQTMTAGGVAFTFVGTTGKAHPVVTTAVAFGPFALMEVSFVDGTRHLALLMKDGADYGVISTATQLPE